jgi:hypothetical protein
MGLQSPKSKFTFICEQNYGLMLIKNMQISSFAYMQISSFA